MTGSLDPRNKSLYRRRGAAYLLPAELLFVAGLNAIFGNPSTATSVSKLVDSRVELVWQVTYTLGGLLITIGVLWPRPATEAVGYWLACWAMALNLIALIIVRGPLNVGPTLAAFVMMITILSLRLKDLHQAAKEVKAEEALKHPFPSQYERRRRGRRALDR